MPKATRTSIPSSRPRQYYDARTYRFGRRTFSNETKRLAWKRCNRQCQGCTAPVTGAGNIQFDHIVPWELSRDSSLGNCQVLCTACHDDKTAAVDLPAIAAADRKADFHLGITGPGRGKRPMPAGKANGSPWSKTIAGKVVPRTTLAQKLARTRAIRQVAP